MKFCTFIHPAIQDEHAGLRLINFKEVRKMSKLSIKHNPKFEEYLSLAQEAKSLREAGDSETATEMEQKAAKGFRELISNTRKDLTEQDENLKKELSCLQVESEFCGKTFCILYGHELSYQELAREHTWDNKDQNRYFVECKLCGWNNSTQIINANYFWHRKIARKKANYNEAAITSKILKALEEQKESTSNLEWKKFAERFLEVQEEIDKKNNELHRIQEVLNEICRLFGHDAIEYSEKYDEDRFHCKCCGKEMDRNEYVVNHLDAMFHGGIVSYYYWDTRPILG